MKKLIILLVLLCAWLPGLKSNPIMPGSLVIEVYFEDDTWYLEIDNYLLDIFGINTFENIFVETKNGSFFFKEDFLPDFSNEVTIVTKDALIFPIDLDKIEDCIFCYYYDTQTDDFFIFTELYWGSYPYSEVGGPYENQSLKIVMVPLPPPDYNDWWLVKDDNPTIGEHDWFYVYARGTYKGFLYDENGNSVSNAEIKYLPDNYLNTGQLEFEPLMTNEFGFFIHEHLFCRYYHITSVIADGMEYYLDEVIAIEPGSILEMDLTIDLSTGIPVPKNSEYFMLSNYPNPFGYSTTFEFSIPKNSTFKNGKIEIKDILGRHLEEINFYPGQSNQEEYKLIWKNNNEFPVGQYYYNLVIDGKKAASTKMIISR